MRISLRKCFGMLAIAMTISMIAETATAQTTTNNSDDDTVTLQEAFERAYYSNDRNFFRNRRLDRQVDWILGTGTTFLNSFTDNEIAGDGRAINRLYRDALRQQVLSDGIIRTPDLENPYDTSLLLLPATSATLSTTSEFIPPPAVVPYSPPPAPVAVPQVAPSRPVPALW